MTFVGWFYLSAKYPTGDWTKAFVNNVIASAVPEPGTNMSTGNLFLSASQVGDVLMNDLINLIRSDGCYFFYVSQVNVSIMIC